MSPLLSIQQHKLTWVDKTMMLHTLYLKLIRHTGYDLKHKRSKQCFIRYKRSVGEEICAKS